MVLDCDSSPATSPTPPPHEDIVHTFRRINNKLRACNERMARRRRIVGTHMELAQAFIVRAEDVAEYRGTVPVDLGTSPLVGDVSPVLESAAEVLVSKEGALTPEAVVAPAADAGAELDGYCCLICIVMLCAWGAATVGVAFLIALLCVWEYLLEKGRGIHRLVVRTLRLQSHRWTDLQCERVGRSCSEDLRVYDLGERRENEDCTTQSIDTCATLEESFDGEVNRPDEASSFPVNNSEPLDLHFSTPQGEIFDGERRKMVDEAAVPVSEEAGDVSGVPLDYDLLVEQVEHADNEGPVDQLSLAVPGDEAQMDLEEERDEADRAISAGGDYAQSEEDDSPFMKGCDLLEEDFGGPLEDDEPEIMPVDFNDDTHYYWVLETIVESDEPEEEGDSEVADDEVPVSFTMVEDPEVRDEGGGRMQLSSSVSSRYWSADDLTEKEDTVLGSLEATELEESADEQAAMVPIDTVEINTVVPMQTSDGEPSSAPIFVALKGYRRRRTRPRQRLREKMLLQESARLPTRDKNTA